LSEEEHVLIANEVSELLCKGAIDDCEHESGEIISNIFLVKFLPVINLREFNYFIEYQHFKQETLDICLKAVEKAGYFTSVGLKYADFSVPISEPQKAEMLFGKESPPHPSIPVEGSVECIPKRKCWFDSRFGQVSDRKQYTCCSPG